jgi:hypothetical protein
MTREKYVKIFPFGTSLAKNFNVVLRPSGQNLSFTFRFLHKASHLDKDEYYVILIHDFIY